jgi:hypothetical protein
MVVRRGSRHVTARLRRVMPPKMDKYQAGVAGVIRHLPSEVGRGPPHNNSNNPSGSYQSFSKNPAQQGGATQYGATPQNYNGYSGGGTNVGAGTNYGSNGGNYYGGGGQSGDSVPYGATAPNNGGNYGSGAGSTNYGGGAGAYGGGAGVGGAYGGNSDIEVLRM